MNRDRAQAPPPAPPRATTATSAGIESRDERIAAELLDLLYRQAPAGLLVTAVNAFVVAFAVSYFFQAPFVWPWFGALFVLLFLRTVLLWLQQRFPAALSRRRWTRLFAAGAGLTGLTWGLSMFTLPWESFTDEVLVSFVIAGMVAGALPGLSAHLQSYVLYLLGALVPVAIRMAMIGGEFGFFFVVLVLMYGGYMFVAARAYHRNLLQSIELGYANAQLIADLTQESENAKALNAKLSDEIEKRRRIADELVSAKEDAESASVAKGEFVANMSHEIRTPMNGVLGMIELLAETDLDARQRGYVEVARTSSESLLGILNAILDFSKIDAGKLELEAIPFDVRGLAEEVAALFTANVQRAHIDLICFVPPPLPTRVVGDQTRLRQILTNLLGNAVKFTERGEVSLRVSEIARTEDRVTFEFAIRDTGIGMTDAQTAALYEPFRQADGSTTRRFGGTGLGLVITKRLVELMGGSIDCRSRVGEGTEFLVRLPLTLQPTAEERPELAGLDGRHALIVDDNPTELEILSHYLDGWGIRSTRASSGEEALELLAAAVRSKQNTESSEQDESADLARGRDDAGPIDIALLDMRMPTMEGNLLAERIRTLPEWRDLPLLLLGSPGGAAGADDGAHRFTDHLAKPVRHGELREALYRALYGNAPGFARTLPTEPLVEALEGRVLLVEDNPVNQKVAASMLERCGVQVDLAANGEEALRRCATTSYDLMLMDIQMPVMDGLEATRALRQREAAEAVRRLPIIAMTANAMQSDRDACFDAGMDDYIAKPVKGAQLRAVLADWLGRERRPSA